MKQYNEEDIKNLFSEISIKKSQERQDEIQAMIARLQDELEKGDNTKEEEKKLKGLINQLFNAIKDYRSVDGWSPTRVEAGDNTLKKINEFLRKLDISRRYK